MKQRLAYIDNYRTFLIIIVITGHISGVYGGTSKGTWPYIELVNDFFTKAALATFDAVILGFVLSSFFFVSGYFVPQAMERKGFRMFITDRIIKFSIPVLFYFLILSQINRYLGQTAKGFDGTLAEFVTQSWHNGIYGRIGIMWFVGALLLFSVAYAFYHKLFSNRSWFIPKVFPSNWQIFAFMASLSLFIYVSRIWFPLKGFSVSDLPIGSMILFFLFFMLGARANQGNWLEKLKPEVVNLWFALVCILIVLAIGLIVTGNSGYESGIIQGGGTILSLSFAVWEVVLGVGILMKLLQLFKRKLNYQSRFSEALSQSSFVAYIIHPTIIILVTVALKPVILFPFAKFLLACGIVLFLVFTLSWLITRIPGVRKFV